MRVTEGEKWVGERKRERAIEIEIRSVRRMDRDRQTERDRKTNTDKYTDCDRETDRKTHINRQEYRHKQTQMSKYITRKQESVKRESKCTN